MKLVVLGLSITSSWGNGHATTFRALLRAFAARGHDVLFLERDKPWYAEHRDLPQPGFCEVALYHSLEELKSGWSDAVADADAVIIGSYVPDGIAVGKWACEIAHGTTAFYDIDTPVTLAALDHGDCDYLSRELIERLDLYLSFTGGPVLDLLEHGYGAARARPLYCSVDTGVYYPEVVEPNVDLGYLGTYSADRQPSVEQFLIKPARRLSQRAFAVAGSRFPAEVAWPHNVRHIDHLSPARHRTFYNRQRFTLNVTRADMIRRGYSPSVRLFEAAACGTPIISDWWEGLDSFFTPGEQIHIVRNSDEVCQLLTSAPPSIGSAARQRVLREHSSTVRALELETLLRATLPAATTSRIS